MEPYLSCFDEIPDKINARNNLRFPAQLPAAMSHSKALIVDRHALRSDGKLVDDLVHVALEAGTQVCVDPQNAVDSPVRR